MGGSYHGNVSLLSGHEEMASGAIEANGIGSELVQRQGEDLLARVHVDLPREILLLQFVRPLHSLRLDKPSSLGLQNVHIHVVVERLGNSLTPLFILRLQDL